LFREPDISGGSKPPFHLGRLQGEIDLAVGAVGRPKWFPERPGLRAHERVEADAQLTGLAARRAAFVA
jgi:hypothetical protein